MAKLILKHNDGTEEVLRENAPDEGYIAMKLWCMEDVENEFEDYFKADNGDVPDFRALTFNELDFIYLDECNDKDWSIIDYAIEKAIKEYRERKGE